MTRRRWPALVIVVTLAACGSGTSDVSDDARAQLQPRVAEIRELANARQADQVSAKLVELRLLVDDLLQRGELTSEGADEVRVAAANVESQLGLITTTTQPPPPAHNDNDDDDEEKEDKD